MTKVIIVNSPLFRDFNPLYDEDSLPPIGLGYIATGLEQAGCDVKLLDAVALRLPLATLVSETVAARPAVVATNVFTTNFDLVRAFVEQLSGHVPHVILGGLSTRTLHELIFRWNFDGLLDVVFGDGERITPELVGGYCQQLPHDATASGSRRYFRVDNASPYFATDIDDVTLKRKYFVNEPVKHPRGFIEAHIVASRGCIYNCAFCAAARSLNADLAIRERSVASIAAEVAEIGAQYPSVTSIRVLDDLFLKGPKSISTAVEVFNKTPHRWRAMAHVNTFTLADDSSLASLRESGCAELFIGVESGSPRVLKSIHKTHDIGRIKQNLERALRAGIPLKAYFIFGFPGETRADFDLTYRLAAELKATGDAVGTEFRSSVFQFRPYHGTELYHSLREQGIEEEQVLQVDGDRELSALVGRLQFNFHSGNYSAEKLEVVRDYIHRTANLATAAQWGLGD